MNLTLSHSISQDEAIRRIKLLSNKLVEEHQKNITSSKQQWNGNKAEVTVIAMGMSFKAQIIITSFDVSAKVNLPFAAVLFKHRIKQEISKHLKNTLS